MRRPLMMVVVTAVLLGGTTAALVAQRASGSRGSVSTASGSASRSGNTASWQGQHATGSKTVSQTGEGATGTKTAQTQSGGTRSTTREVDAENKEVDKTTTTTTAWGESATRSRETEGQGGYATVEGSASTSTGRAASGEGAVARNAYGQPVAAGTVNTKYNGTYNAAAARTPYGGWNTAVAGPYGGKVTTTLPSGYRTSTYYGRSYYTYGGSYYRPYTYHGTPYYYPVPPPYYAYYESPPAGATILMLAGVKYLVSQDGSYSKQSTTSDGKTAYQSVPAPQGATIKTLPAQRVLVTVAGTTYYLNANAFYRRVMDGAQETFVVVTPPAGVVFIPALPPDFEVVQLNTMYFTVGGQYYVPYLAADGKELYVLVDRPPTLPAPTPTPAPAPAPAAARAPKPSASSASSAAPASPPSVSSAAPVQAVALRFEVPLGTLLIVRLATEVNSATALVGNRVQGYLDQDLITNDSRMVAPKGARVYGVVTAVEGKKKGSVSVTLTDLPVGGRIVAIKTQPLSAKGGVIPAQTPQAFTLAAPLQVETMTNVAVR